MQRPAAILLGLAVVVLGAVIGFLLFSSPEEPVPEPSPTVSVIAEPSPSTSASAGASLKADLLDRRWTVLYVGTDVDEARESREEPVNADALMVISLSADQSQLTLVSLPRDTVDVPLADGGSWDSKINSLYRERGIEALVGAMETLYGVPIDAHVVFDMDDFAGLVEAVGGIAVSPPEPILDPIVSLDLPAGLQGLDGPTTLGYVRTRIDQDYGRMGRQQEVVVSLLDALLNSETDLDLRAALDSFDSLETDLPLDDLETLLELARRASDAEVRAILIEPPLITFEGDRGDGRGYVLEPDIEAIRAEVQEQELIGE
ncbi:MAG: LCP family protein [Candidatus Limnocylindria bacterium]